VSRLYDDELRGVGLRTTQYSLLRRLGRAAEIRQRDLGGLTSLDETTLTRNLPPDRLRLGSHRHRVRPAREAVRVTEAGAAKLRKVRPVWERAQERMRSRLPDGTWPGLLAVLPDVAPLADEA
jgi:hypothetical protein